VRGWAGFQASEMEPLVTDRLMWPACAYWGLDALLLCAEGFRELFEIHATNLDWLLPEVNSSGGVYSQTGQRVDASVMWDM
jgi:hypothetical protein